MVPPTGDAGTLLKHPDFNGIAPYTMPNMTTIESTNCYAAALDFLAKRYSASNMRIAHWIIHNEVDGGSHWTNMGDKPIATFMDTYLRSILRINMTSTQKSLSLSHMAGTLLPVAGGIK